MPVKQNTQWFIQVKHAQSTIRIIHAKSLKGLLMRSKIQVGIIEGPKYAHIRQERKRSKSKIFNNNTDVSGQAFTGKSMYGATRENYKQFYKKREVENTPSQQDEIGKNLY